MCLAKTKDYTSSSPKHDAGSIMQWDCFSAAGPGSLVNGEAKLKARKYRNVLKENLNLSAT